MTCRLDALCIDANDPPDLAQFWGALLGWVLLGRPLDGDGDGIVVRPGDGTGFGLRFVPTREQKSAKNQLHPDLTSASLEDQRRTVARAVELGARHVDIGQGAAERHVVLADPEGNEFCVIEPGNEFLAGCGFLGALACDGSRQVGYFWRDVLGWPLVWDRDEETAIRSPHGGPKITWGGPPFAASTGRNRLRFDLVPTVGADQQAEAERLVALGAARVTAGRAGSRIELADPDGNEFGLLPPR